MQIEAYLINLFKYSFKSDDGRQIEGVSVRFIVPDEGGSDNQIGASIQKMSMPIDSWESLQSQGLQTFSKVKLTFSGFGRHSRLVNVEDVAKAATIIIALLVIIGAYLFIVKFAFWLVLIAVIAVLIGVYFVEHTNQIWRTSDARKAVTTVVDGLARKGFINRDYFKLTGLSMPSEKLRTFNRAVYELELAKSEVNIDIVSNGNVLTYESQQSWHRYLLDNSERSSFDVQRVALIDRDSHYLLRIIFHDNKHCQLLKRDEVYNKQSRDRDF